MLLRSFVQFEQMLEEELQGQKAGRGEFIAKTYKAKWEGLPGFKEFDDFLDAVGKADPTKNGAYMQWIAKLCIKNPNENRAEDLERLAGDLKEFETFKSKIEKKDINAYKSFSELFDVIEPFLQPKAKTAEEKKEERAAAKIKAAKGEIDDVYAGAEGWIKIPTTKAAAQILGQSTRWCTSAKSNNMFDHYSKKDSLFIIYDKKKKTRHQLHIQDGQFADDKDKNVGVDAVPQWARDPIIKWYKDNVKGLSLKHLATLTSFGSDDIAKGTDHEDLMDLMKQYGV